MSTQQTLTVSATGLWQDSFTGALQVPRFNEPNATLQSAVVTVDSSFTSALTVNSQNAFPSRLVFDQSFTLTAQGYTPLFRNTHVDTVIPKGVTVFNPTIAGNFSESIAVTDLSTVSGPGFVSFPVTGVGTSSMRRSGSGSTSWTISEQVTVSVEYTYSE